MKGRALILLLMGLAGFCCRAAPTVSDTGYVGTWSRGNERVTSTLSIYRVGDRYLFRPDVDSHDGGRELKCDWNGSCERFSYGEKTAEYTFRTWVERETGYLMVEYEVRSLGPLPEESHYVDRLVLQPGGLALKVYTVERGEEMLEPGSAPARTFTKIADGVAFPPAPRSS